CIPYVLMNLLLLIWAAQKLNLTSRKKGLVSDSAPSHLSTCFRGIIQKNPPPVPSSLLQAAARTKDSPNTGKVDAAHFTAPPNQQKQKTKNKKEVFLTEVCADVLADVIRCVVSGSDGCVLGLGCADVGSWSSMVGSDESFQRLGLIPCAISWLYSAVERRKEKTWTDLTVSVSAIELCCGEDETLRDLLAEAVPSLGSVQDSPAAQISLQEDPVYGIQLRNLNRVKAPTAERAASLLDAAITARRHGDIIMPLSHSSIMFFTLHVQPPRTESSTISKGGSDTFGCHAGLSLSNLMVFHVFIKLCTLYLHVEGSKLSMLLRQTLGHVNGQVAVIAQVSDSPTHLQEALFTIQLASRIRRTQKRTKSTSCSPSGRSLSKERRGTPSLSLRAFHSTGEVDVDIPRIRLCGELDERSSSDQSCDTVIHIDSDGSVQAKAAPTLALPEFVPIIPSLNRSNIPQLQEDKKKEESPERDCLKCDTFAELQERLGCIDGSEVATDVPKLSSKGSPANKMTTKPQPQKDSGKQTDTEAQQTLLLNQELSFNQTSVGEKKADGTFPGDSFQREDSGLYDCEDGSAASSSEEPLNQTQSLNMICQDSLSEVSNTRPPQLPVSLQDCDVDDQSNSLTLTVQPTGSKGSPKDGDESQPERRTSPVGKSSPISPSLFTPTSSCSSSPSMATSVILGDILPHLPTEEVKEMKATITVTVKQPLDLKGQDELVFSMVEEVTISGALDRGRTNGNIIHFRDTANSPAQAQGSASSQPIRIISNVSEESAAAGCADLGKNPVGQTTEAITQKPLYQLRGEKRFLPSFINPMLINTDVDGEKDGAKQRGNHDDSFIGINPLSVPTKTNTNCSEDAKALEEENGAFAVQNDKKKSDCISVSPLHQISYDTPVFEDAALYNETTENKACGKRPRHTDRSHPRGRERVYPINTPRGLSGGEIGRKLVGNAPERIAASPGCPATIPASFKTTSLPRGWHNANSQESHWGNNTADNHRNPGGVTSSTPCSPRVTLEKRQGRQHSPANRSPCFSSPRKYSMEYRQEASSLARKGAASLFEASSLTKKHDSLSGSIKSPIEDSSRLFSAKLEQLASRTNSLGTTPGDFQTLDRGSSSTSVSSKGRDSTLPRASRSPRRTPRPIPMPEQSYHFTTSNNQPSQSPKSTHSKLSAVGKLKIASPKVRRLSAPSTKNLSLSHKGLRQSINRSASLSPDGKIERTSSFLSLSPPWSLNSISRTPSQSSTYSSRKSPIQGFMSGRISDLLKDRETSSTSGGLDKTPTHSLVTVDRLSGHPSSLNHHPLPSPYSRVTAPRMPSHMSGHASDATSVLSGELPPAMGKTSLLFPNRNSVVSSGYESMVRDSEATGSSTSNRDSVSDRSGSLLSIARSSRTSRRRGPHQRRLSHDASLSMRRSASGLRARWVDRGIPEAYEIKVYEIDNVERMQTRAGAEVIQFAKLKFLEHRQQRIAEVRAKYNNLRRELDRAKQDLMLEPAKWNQEFDLWQTFEVDSLEHLEALEVVTARLESKVNLCKANVMMVTCFDVSSKRRNFR
uniref:Kinesin motor domain-containing protein n=1 Tax=Myripristis murdjan TaxID=586833 RepID=A0A667WW18_9TELE